MECKKKFKHVQQGKSLKTVLEPIQRYKFLAAGWLYELPIIVVCFKCRQGSCGTGNGGLLGRRITEMKRANVSILNELCLRSKHI